MQRRDFLKILTAIAAAPAAFALAPKKTTTALTWQHGAGKAADVTFNTIQKAQLDRISLTNNPPIAVYHEWESFSLATINMKPGSLHVLDRGDQIHMISPVETPFLTAKSLKEWRSQR
jgi:hypothetical protein